MNQTQYTIGAVLPKDFYETFTGFDKRVRRKWGAVIAPYNSPPHLTITPAIPTQRIDALRNITEVIEVILREYPFGSNYDCMMAEAETKDDDSVILPVDLSSLSKSKFANIRNLLAQRGVFEKGDASNHAHHSELHFEKNIVLAQLTEACPDTATEIAEEANSLNFLWPSIIHFDALALYESCSNGSVRMARSWARTPQQCTP